MTAFSIGLVGATPLDTVRELAPRVEAAGYRALWFNDNPNGDSLAAVATAAEVTSTLGLSTGVIPLDRVPATEIARRVRDLGLPVERLRLGIGSGGARRGLSLLADGIAELDELDVPVLVGALGPKTRTLAAREADGILFNWLTPAAALEAHARLHTEAEGRRVEGVLYARTIVDAGSRPALEVEAGRYRDVPAYAANFARLGIDPLDTAIDLSHPDWSAPYSGLDEVVLRVVTPSASVAEIAAIVDAGAPAR